MRLERFKQARDKGDMDVIRTSPFSILKYAQAIDDDLDSVLRDEARQRVHLKRNDRTFDSGAREYRSLARGVSSGHGDDWETIADKRRRDGLTDEPRSSEDSNGRRAIVHERITEAVLRSSAR